MGSKPVRSNFLHIFGVRKKIKKKIFQEKSVFIGKIGDFSPIFFFRFFIPISFPAPSKSDFSPKNRPKSAIFLSMFTPILKCIKGKDIEYVLREVHEGICGNHIGARALAGKVLRQGYYWPTILKDATDLVKKCKIFQEHTMISRLPSEPLTSITSP